MKRPYLDQTPAQRRSFYLLTLAQIVHLEDTGTRMTHTSARRQAIAALDLSPQAGANGITTDEIIAALRDAAKQARGLVGLVPPRNAIPPRDHDDQTV